ncbi:TPA: hypothetical protein ACH3X3_009023 [Trebouxia sp. C0006]
MACYVENPRAVLMDRGALAKLSTVGSNLPSQLEYLTDVKDVDPTALAPVAVAVNDALGATPQNIVQSSGNVTAAVADQLVSSAYLGTQSNATPGTSAQQLAQAVTSSKLSSQDQAAAFAQAIQLAQELVMEWEQLKK